MACTSLGRRLVPRPSRLWIVVCATAERWTWLRLTRMALVCGWCRCVCGAIANAALFHVSFWRSCGGCISLRSDADRVFVAAGSPPNGYMLWYRPVMVPLHVRGSCRVGAIVEAPTHWGFGDVAPLSLVDVVLPRPLVAGERRPVKFARGVARLELCMLVPLSSR